MDQWEHVYWTCKQEVWTQLIDRIKNKNKNNGTLHPKNRLNEYFLPLSTVYGFIYAQRKKLWMKMIKCKFTVGLIHTRKILKELSVGSFFFCWVYFNMIWHDKALWSHCIFLPCWQSIVVHKLFGHHVQKYIGHFIFWTIVRDTE